MTSISCAVTEVLVAVGDSYWRCVSCQLQFSRHVSIDEHISLKHGSNEDDRDNLVTEPHLTVSHSHVHIPVSTAYQSHNLKFNIQNQDVMGAVAEHHPHVTSCLIPDVVKVNLDVSAVEKTSNPAGPCFTNSCSRISEMCGNKVSEERHSLPTDSISLQFSLQHHEISSSHDISGQSSEANFSGSGHLNNHRSVMTDDDQMACNSGLTDSAGNNKQSVEMESNYDAEEEDGEKGNRSLLNSMLSLLEKSMDMDDINGVIQNWDALNPELLEQQLLNNNSELSPHSLHPGALDSADNPLSSTEELLNTAVESIDSQVEFMDASPDMLPSTSSINNTNDKVPSIESSPEKDITTESTHLPVEDISCSDNKKVSGMDENHSDTEAEWDQEMENEEEDEEDNNENSDTDVADNIIQCIESYLDFSNSQWNKALGSGSVGSMLEKTAVSSISIDNSANSYYMMRGGLSDENAAGGSTQAEGNSVMCETNKDIVTVCSKAASELAKFCLRKSKNTSEGQSAIAPHLFFASSGSHLAKLRSNSSECKLQQSSAEAKGAVINDSMTRENYDIIHHENGRNVAGQAGAAVTFTNGLALTVKGGESLLHNTSNNSPILHRKMNIHNKDDFCGITNYRHSPCIFTTEVQSNSAALCCGENEGDKLDESSNDPSEENDEFKGSTSKSAKVSNLVKGEKHKSRISNASLSMLQIKKLKSDVLAIMKNQQKASKTSSKRVKTKESKSHGKRPRTELMANSPSATSDSILKQVQGRVRHVQATDKWKVCQVCDRRFSTHRALQRHIKVNSTAVDPCTCKVCEKKFHGLSQLNVHIYKCHEVKGRPTCLRCNAKFNTVRRLFQHVQRFQKPTEGTALPTSKKGKAWRCSACGMVCLNQPKIIAAHKCKGHLRKCSKCDKKFPTQSALNVHMAAHLGRMYKCDICGQFFKNKLSRQHHKLTHTAIKGQFICQICGRQFEYQHKLTAHGKVHTKDKRQQPTYKCDECGKHYKNKKCLQRHVDVDHHGIKDYAYKCEHCHQQFFCSWQLRDHMSWHHFGEKPYRCQYCGQGFVCRPTLVRHQRKEHTGVKPHKCRYCEEAFVDKKNLDIHEVKVHTGLFPFKCPQCDKGFVHKSTLRTHQRQHTNSRPHQCHICGNSYTKANHLKRHTVSCLKKNNVPATETLSLDMEHLPNIPPRPPSNLTALLLPQLNEIAPYPGVFLTQNI